DSLQEEAPVYRQRPQAALRRSRRGRRRHLVTLFLPRPTGTHRRAGLHHQDLTEVSPMLPVYSVTYLPGCSMPLVVNAALLRLVTARFTGSLHMWPVATLTSCGTARPYPSTYARVASFMWAINAARDSSVAAATISPAGTADRCRSKNSSGGGRRSVIRTQWTATSRKPPSSSRR